MSKHGPRRDLKPASKTNVVIAAVAMVLLWAVVIGVLVHNSEKPSTSPVVPEQQPSTAEGVQHPSLNPVSASKPGLGTGELEVVYTTQDGVRHVVTESDMVANLVRLVDCIQDGSAKNQWEQLLGQIDLPRNSSQRFLYVMPSDLQSQLSDNGWFGVSYEDPDPGCMTLWVNSLLLCYPGRAKDPAAAQLSGEITLVHELVHIQDAREGRMGQFIQSLKLPPGENNAPGTEASNLAFQGRLELFASEARAAEAEYIYADTYWPGKWEEIATPAAVECHQAWEAGRRDEFIGLVHSQYENLIFAGQEWSEQERAEVRTWMLNEVVKIL